MWTGRRILLLLTGFVAFLTVYGVYVVFLGGIDGLPPLPAEFWPEKQGEPRPLPPSAPVSERDRKLRMAFGEG